jgi:hypothetical protein
MPTRTYVARFLQGSTPLFNLYEINEFRGMEDELNYRLIQLPYGDAILSGDGTKSYVPLEISFKASIANVQIEAAGYALSNNSTSLVNNLINLLRLATQVRVFGKRFRNLTYQKAIPIITNSASSDITATYLTDDDPIDSPVLWITAETLPTATVDVNYSYQLTAESEISAVTYSKVAGYPGINISGTGLITWNSPYTINTQSILVRATDTSGNAADKLFYIPVVGGLYPSFYPTPDLYPLR